MLLALREYLKPRPSVVLRGSGRALDAWQAVLERHFDPGRHVLVVPEDAGDLPGSLAERGARAVSTGGLHL